MNCWLIVLSILATFTLSSTTLAGPVTWEFAGEITSVQDNQDLIGDSIFVGSPFSGSFTFRSTTTDTFSTNPDVGSYSNALSDFHGSIGTLLFSGPTGVNSISVRNGVPGFPSDGFGVSAIIDFLGRQMLSVLSFTDESGSIISSGDLPIDPFSLELFDRAEFILVNGNENTGALTRIDGRVTTLVPEPNTLILLGLGAGLIFKRKRPGCPILRVAKGGGRIIFIELYDRP